MRSDLCSQSTKLVQSWPVFVASLGNPQFSFASSSPSLLASHIEQGQVLFQQTWATIDMIVGLPGAGQVFMKLDIFVLMFRSEHEIQICRLAFLGLGL